MQNNLVVIVVSGIFKRERFIKHLKSQISGNNCNFLVFEMSWLGKNTYKEDYQKLHNLITELSNSGNKIALIGTSAGASVARNLFSDKNLKILRLVTICGPIKDINSARFKLGKLLSPTWKTSLEISSKNSSYDNSQNVLTIVPKFDELVPLTTMAIEGSNKLLISGYEHLYSITTAMSKHARVILEFMNIPVV